MERGKAGISPGSHLAPVPSVDMPGPGQGSLGRPYPSPSPTDAHQHGPQLHAARELQAAAKAQRLLQVLLTGLGDSCRDRGQRGSSGPSPKPPVGGAALPPEATETIQRAVTDPRLRARVQELDSNPHPIGSRTPQLSMSPQRQLVPGARPRRLCRVPMQETLSSASPFLWLSSALAPLWGGNKSRVRGHIQPPSLELMQGYLLIDSKRRLQRQRG